MNNKLITIITVVYNSVDLIEDTIKSIIRHDSNIFEYVVIDGGSSDGTIQIIENFLSDISIFISEPDKGIYDAMNKGIKASSGKYIGFINCGDRLLYLPVKELLTSEGFHLNCFPVLLTNQIKFIPKDNWTLKIRNNFPHQGCFYKNTENLIFDTKYKVYSDFDLNQKYYKSKNKIKVFDKPTVAFHDMGGISNERKHSNEIFKVIRNNFGIFYCLVSLLYFKKQGLLNRFKNFLF